MRERGVVHLHDKDDFYEADLWMWNLTLSGLSNMFLHEVDEIDILRYLASFNGKNSRNGGCLVSS